MVTDAADTLLHAVYEYRTLLMRAFVCGDALPVPQKVKLSGLDRTLAIDADVTEPHTREFERTPMRLPAQIGCGGGRIRARAVDLGAGGACLRGAPMVPSGEIVTVRVDGPRDYRFPARVVWFTRAPDGWVIGFAFIGAPVELRRRASYEH
jgi:hypothetical protein